LPPALQYGDLAALGLVGWNPAGMVRWSLEVINVATGLPWFWTLVAGSIFWKAVLVPLSVQGLRNSARILPLQPQIVAAQEEMKRIRKSGDKITLQRHALKMRKMYQEAGVNMGATALIPFVQIPVTLGMFFGVKNMCNLPVIQLTQSGLDMLPDLTVPDPYMILPILLCAAVNMQIQVSDLVSTWCR
jgi:YidC/Oxa1 family membrane protein insertase